VISCALEKYRDRRNGIDASDISSYPVTEKREFLEKLLLLMERNAREVGEGLKRGAR
jgi:hypothetical protein